MSRERKCSVAKCGRSSHKNPKLRFFAIPKDPELRPKWMENLKIKRLFYKVTYVCSIHFEDEAQSENHRLKKNAIPTLHLGYDGLVPHKFVKHYVVQRKCCIESCKIQHLIKRVKTYTFPDDKNERLAWARACNLPLPLPDKDIYICQRHFERKYKSKMRLLPGAFPKFFLRGEDAEDVEQSNAESNGSDAEQSNEEGNASYAEQSDESRIDPGVEEDEDVPVKLTYSMNVEEDEIDHITTQESDMELNQDLPVKFTYSGNIEEDDSDHIEYLPIGKSEDIELPSQEDHMQIINIQIERLIKCDGTVQAQGVVSNEVLPVELIYSRVIEEDKSGETSEDLVLSPYEEQIQNLHAQIEGLKKRVMFLKDSAIYPQPGASEEAVTFARMIVGDKKTEYTEKEKALAKRLRSNILSDDYSFLKQDLGFRLPLLKAVKRKRKLPENDRNLIKLIHTLP